MKEQKKALLIVGSAKAHPSTSASLGGFFVGQLRKGGFETRTLMANKAIKTSASRQALIRSVEEAQLMVLAFPLYVDCLPYPVIRVLEIIAAYCSATKNATPKRVVAMVNCGFPEAHHNRTALAICRQFARQIGWQWCGGLAMGSGGIIDGKPLKKIKGLARNPIRSLDLAAEALCQHHPIPDKAVQLMAKPMIPHWLYRTIATLMFRLKARRCGTTKQLYRRPFST